MWRLFKRKFRLKVEGDPYVNIPSGVELRLAGSPGSLENVLMSQGSGTNPIWHSLNLTSTSASGISSNSFARATFILPYLPSGTNSYGSMVLWRNRFLFILQGYGQTGFWCFDLRSCVFRTLAAAPAVICYGSLAGVYANRYLYTCQGYSTSGGASTTFYRYDILTDSWSTVASIPGAVDYYGGGAVYDGTQYIYLIRGSSTTSFYRYDCAANSWTTLASTPAATYAPSNPVKAGNYLYVLAGNSTTTFYRYDISANSWTTMAAAPAATSAGALAWDGGDYIYALRGGGYTDFWRYRISTNTWEILTSAPAATNWGGLVYYNDPIVGGIVLVRQGNTTTNWWVYKV
jgi:N-acetylneuraminic acid mutarotase